MTRTEDWYKLIYSGYILEAKSVLLYSGFTKWPISVSYSTRENKDLSTQEFRTVSHSLDLEAILL